MVIIDMEHSWEVGSHMRCGSILGNCPYMVIIDIEHSWEVGSHTPHVACRMSTPGEMSIYGNN